MLVCQKKKQSTKKIWGLMKLWNEYHKRIIEMLEVSKEHMRDETLNALLQDFESKAHRDENDIVWYARDLQVLLGYTSWDKFDNGAINDAKKVCENLKGSVDNNFQEVFSRAGKNSQKEMHEKSL